MSFSRESVMSHQCPNSILWDHIACAFISLVSFNSKQSLSHSLTFTAFPYLEAIDYFQEYLLDYIAGVVLVESIIEVMLCSPCTPSRATWSSSVPSLVILSWTLWGTWNLLGFSHCKAILFSSVMCNVLWKGSLKQGKFNISDLTSSHWNMEFFFFAWINYSSCNGNILIPSIFTNWHSTVPKFLILSMHIMCTDGFLFNINRT